MIFVRMGRIWTNCIQLYLQPHIVCKEQILLFLVQTCHSLVLAGVICCNWITGFWRMTDALFIDSLYSELVCLSFSKAQDRASAGFHRLVIARDPILWPSNTPEMKHSPWNSFMVFPQHIMSFFAQRWLTYRPFNIVSQDRTSSIITGCYPRKNQAVFIYIMAFHVEWGSRCTSCFCCSIYRNTKW